jgi:GxxExxY protein
MSSENKITKSIVDAAYKIHTATGPGLLESFYESILSYELRKNGNHVDVSRQQSQSTPSAMILVTHSKQI